MAVPPMFDFDESKFYRSSLVSEPPSLHSRESSASDLSPSPITPTFSNNHSRIASTCSSMSCSPEARNTILDDLPEDPDEYDLGDVAPTRFSKLPSLRKGTPTTAICTTGARSTSSSRTPSRKTSLTKSMMTHLEELDLDDDAAERPRESLHQCRSEAVDIKRLDTKADKADESGLSTTPLLPPAMLILERRDSDAPSIQSPLQSPTVAEISRSPDRASAVPSRSSRVSIIPSTEIPDLDIEEPDEWSAKLGHANYHISPEPYRPDGDKASCLQFSADWEAARKAYAEHADHISEHYGATSQTYKLTEQKWAAIDALWKDNYMTIKQHDLADVPMFEDHPTIVGPMVQYPAKTQPKASRRASVIKYLDRLAGLRS